MGLTNAGCPPGRDELAYPATHGHRHDVRPGTTANKPPRNSEPLDELLVRQVHGQCAITGAENILPELLFVARENFDAFAPPRNRHVPLLPVCGRFDGGIGEQDVIHGFAL